MSVQTIGIWKNSNQTTSLLPLLLLNLPVTYFNRTFGNGSKFIKYFKVLEEVKRFLIFHFLEASKVLSYFFYLSFKYTPQVAILYMCTVLSAVDDETGLYRVTSSVVFATNSICCTANIISSEILFVG